MARPVVTHALFDMDGLLLDTETFYTVAQQKICSRFGKEFTWDTKAKMMGKKALEAAQILIDDLELHGKITAEDFVTEREITLDSLFPESELLPGVDRLVRHLKEKGVPMCVATSSKRGHYELKTSKHRELFGLFDVRASLELTPTKHIVTGDDTSKGKPDPEIFLIAKDRWEPAPDASSCLVFEDAPTGVQAAVAAGMASVMVPAPQLKDPEASGPSQILKSLGDFKPQEWGLPAYE